MRVPVRPDVLTLGLLYALVLLAVPTAAQEGPVNFEFSFSNPGARSMGLGGAFAALADDATAAFANPAGLVQLIEPEVSLEGRLWSYDTPFVAGGRASGDPSGIGIDTVDGIRFGISSSELVDVSFLSLVYPARTWSLAVYRHRWADYELTSHVNGLFGVEDDEVERAEDLLARTELQIIGNGLAGAAELTDTLSFGVGAVFYEVNFDSYTDEFTHDEDDLFAPNPFLPELLDTHYYHRAKESGFSMQAGLLWRPSVQLSIGGYFRQGPKLQLHVTEITGPAEEDHEPGYIDLDVKTPLHMPDVLGLGVAFHSKSGALTVSLEWDRIRYSNISEDLDTQIFDADQVAIADGDELRLGFEYVLIGSRPAVALRLGVWHDPAHGLGSGPAADLFERAILYGGDDQIHYCGGIGLAFNKVQIDLGADLADTVDQASLSMVYRF